MKEPTKRARLEAAIRGELLDRPPVALWRHFPVDDQIPDDLAESTAQYQLAYDFDFVKVTPASSFCLLGWGIQDEWRGNVEGTREYTSRPIQNPSQWLDLEALDPGTGALDAQRRCLELLREKLGPETPIIQTVFSPLAQAKNLAGGERLFSHLHQAPDSVLAGLQTISDSTTAWVSSLAGTGIDGIFYAIQHASYRYFDAPGYQKFGEPFDMPILESAGEYWLNVLHLHGTEIHFDLAGRYPVQVVNWHDREGSPDLALGREIVRGAVCGGVLRDTLVLGSPADVRAEAAESFSAAGSRGVILGTGCVTPILAPRANIQALRDSVNFA